MTQSRAGLGADRCSEACRINAHTPCARVLARANRELVVDADDAARNRQQATTKFSSALPAGEDDELSCQSDPRPSALYPRRRLSRPAATTADRAQRRQTAPREFAEQPAIRRSNSPPSPLRLLRAPAQAGAVRVTPRQPLPRRASFSSHARSGSGWPRAHPQASRRVSARAAGACCRPLLQEIPNEAGETKH